MATIINTPPAGESSDSGLGLVLGVIITLILITLFIIYVLPGLRAGTTPRNDSLDINVTLPTGQTTPSPTN